MLRALAILLLLANLLVLGWTQGLFDKLRGTRPEADYVPPIYSFGKHTSANGIVEYQGNAFGGRLKRRLTPDSALDAVAQQQGTPCATADPFAATEAEHRDVGQRTARSTG